MLTRAEIKGFRRLRDVSVELGPFDVLPRHRVAERRFVP